MHIEHSVPPPKSPEVRLQLDSTVEVEQGSTTRARSLLSELRHLLENGCTLSTALDALDETEAAVHALARPASRFLPAVGGIERLNLVAMLDQALRSAAGQIATSNTVVLNRKSARRIVLARRHELAALLEEVIRVAVQSCAAATGLRILRLRTRDDHRHCPCLTVEHSGDWATPCEPIKKKAEGIEITQDPARCTIALTFLNRP